MMDSAGLSVQTDAASTQIGEGDSNWQVGGRRTLDARARADSGPRTKQDVFK